LEGFPSKKNSKSKIKDKKLCKHCEKLFVNLTKHKGFCRDNPENYSRLKKERDEYRKKNEAREKARISNYNRIYGLKKRDQINKNRKKNSAKNRLKINAKHNTSRNELERKRKKHLFKILGGYICAQCKFKDHRALEIEHIYDTGYLDERRFTDTRQERAHYVKNPIEAIKNLQILCSNCNEIKLYDNRKKNGMKQHTVHVV